MNATTAIDRFVWREWRFWLLALPGLLLGLVLVIPLLVLLWHGMTREFWVYWTSPSFLSAIRLSLLTSAMTTSVALLAGTPLAYALGRLSFRGKTWIELALDVPIVLPPLIAGIALLLAFGQNGVFGRFLATLGIRLPFTTAAVIFAQTFVAVPLYLRAARIGFGAVAPELREEATVEGANEWQVFRHVMLPVAWRALIAGLILCWTRALGEFGATIVFAGNMEGRTQTIPLAIFVGFETNLDIALALSIVLVLLSLIVLVVLRWIDKAYSRSTTL